MERKTKQPRETLDFDFNCERSLGDSDNVIDAYASYTGPDTSLVIEKIEPQGETVKVWVSGGTDRATYKIELLIPTDAGRVIEAEMQLAVKEK